jgi:hypothetical protein
VTGPTGATGAYQPADFIGLYLTGSLNSIPPGSAIPFTNFSNESPETKITFNGPTGVITIASSGYYQVAFGVMLDTTATATQAAPAIFNLVVNSQATVPSQQIIEIAQPMTTIQQMYSLTTILQLTGSSSTISIVNGGANTIAINGAGTGGPAAYVTILKLQ